MKLNYFCGYLLSLIAGAFLLASPCGAQPQIYETTQAHAIARAKAEGKMILTEFGRPNCADCTGMRGYFEGSNPPLKQWILASCVLWTADVDTSTEWSPYAAGITGYALPLMCFVDPATPGTYTLRETGLIDAYTFMQFVQSQAKKNLPLVVTNLPGVPLTNLVNGTFIVKGVARTNAAFSGSISGVPITAVMWRLNGTGAFQPATGTTSWSAQVSLSGINTSLNGTNTFESYVQYEGPKNSWTNRVTLINLGSGGTSLQSQTITFNSLAPQTYGDGPITLSAIGGGSASPVIFTNTGPATISGSVLTITGAGLVTVTANQAGDATYSAAPPVSQSFIVSNAVLTVTANDASRSYGTTNPLFTASYSGFVNGDTNVGYGSVISGSFSFTPPATPASIAGSYPIIITNSTLSATNYRISFVNGTLTITNLIGIVNYSELQAVLQNGIVDQADLNAVLARYWAQSPPYITNSTFPERTNFCFNITNFVFTVQVSTNLQNWANLNSQARISFTDTNAVSGPARFYRLVASTNASF
jgi:hypothetical protein